MKKFILLILVVAFYSNYGQEVPKVKWYTIEEAYKLQKEKPKKIFVDLYTQWCGWCKVMDKNTFSHPIIAELLNKYYYPVKFDAESKDSIVLGDKVFKNRQTGRRATHDFAIQITNGKLSYPTMVYISENFQPLSVVPGYQNPNVFESIILWFAWNAYSSVPYEEFKKRFKNIIPEPVKKTK